MQTKVKRKHTNTTFVRNALARRSLVPAAPTTADYRRQAIEAASAPLTGPIGDVIVKRNKQAREAEARGEKADRDRYYLPNFNDIMW
jgi:hypothetical protein